MLGSRALGHICVIVLEANLPPAAALDLSTGADGELAGTELFDVVKCAQRRWDIFQRKIMM